MIPFEETIKSKEELIAACKKGFEDYSNKKISKNDFCMYFGFVHGQAITTFYEGNYEQLLVDGGFNTGSGAYFSGGINAWKNLRDGKYIFPPFLKNNIELEHSSEDLPLQKITYGAPGTGKSHGTNEVVRKFKDTVRTTFHPDSDYSTFVGSYKPTTTKEPVLGLNGTTTVQLTDPSTRKPLETTKIVYKFIKQAFLKAYILAWKKMCNKGTITTSTVTVRTPITFEFGNAKCDQVEIVVEGKDTKVKYCKVDYRQDLKSDVQSKWETLWENDEFTIPVGQQSGASLEQAICQKIHTELAEKQEPKKSDFEQGWTLLMEALKQGEEVTAEKVDGNQSYILSYDKTKECLIVTTTANSKKNTLEKNFNDKTYRKDKDGKPTSAEGCINDILKGYDDSDFNEAWNKFEEDVKNGGKLTTTTVTTPTDIRQFLVIEEINRGNCAQIFGDLFQLLDRKNGFSEYPIEADEDLAKCIKEELEGLSFDKNVIDYINQLFVDDEMNPQTFDLDGRPVYALEAIQNGKILVLPSNLHIWATMNTSDQSLFPIDSAFKRRWDWEYKPIIKPADKNWKIQVGPGYEWWTFLEEVNKIINELTSSEDKKLGYFFAKAKKVGDKDVVDIDTMVNKVFFYLWNDVFKDYDLGHLQSFPKIKEDTSKTDSKERPYSFGDFFDKVKGEINKKAVEDFMKAFMPNTATTATATTAAGTTPQEPTEQTTE